MKGSSTDVHFGLQVEIAHAWEFPDIFPETEQGHLAALTRVISRLKRDVLIHDILVKHNLTIQDFPNKDPYGPVGDCCQIIEARGFQVYRGTYGGWLTRDTFEAAAFDIYGMNRLDYERWYDALKESEISTELVAEMTRQREWFERSKR